MDRLRGRSYPVLKEPGLLKGELLIMRPVHIMAGDLVRVFQA